MRVIHHRQTPESRPVSLASRYGAVVREFLRLIHYNYRLTTRVAVPVTREEFYAARLVVELLVDVCRSGFAV